MFVCDSSVITCEDVVGSDVVGSDDAPLDSYAELLVSGGRTQWDGFLSPAVLQSSCKLQSRVLQRHV